MINYSYSQFLEENNVISKEKFNELLKSFGDINIDNLICNYGTEESDIIEAIINNILKEFNYVYIASFDINNKKVELGDVSSVEDLFEIKNILDKGEWTISNFEDLKSDLEELENNSTSEKLKLISDISLTELKNILNDYKRSITE